MNLGLAKWLDRAAASGLGRAVAALDAVVETLAPPGPVERVDRVLVVKFWGLGNWALLRPVVLDLRAAWPAARFTIATLPGNRPLVEDLADDVLLVAPRSVRRVATDLARAVGFLRRAPHALAIDFEPFAQSGALLARLGGAAQRLGFAGPGGRQGLYTATVPFRDDAHVARSFRDLAEAAGVPPGPYVPGRLPVDPAAAARVRRFTRSAPFAVLHPGSGDNFPGRRWSEAGFQALGRALVTDGLRVLVTGSRHEAALAARVAAGVGPRARSVAGRTPVAELVALIAAARIVASNDTAPVHLASAAGTPVLGFYGPNTPVRYGPLARGSHAFWRRLPCSPCLTNASYRSSRCRIHTCMATIPTGEVVARARRLVAGPREEVRA